MTLHEDILQEALARDNEAQANYEALVNDYIAGKPIDKTTVFPILQAANKKPEAFGRDVTLQTRLAELKEIIDADEQYRSDQIELNVEYKVIFDNFNEQERAAINGRLKAQQEYNQKNNMIEVKRLKVRQARLEINKLTELKVPDEPINSLPGEYARDWNRSTLATGAN